MPNSASASRGCAGHVMGGAGTNLRVFVPALQTPSDVCNFRLPRSRPPKSTQQVRLHPQQVSRFPEPPGTDGFHADPALGFFPPANSGIYPIVSYS